MMQLEGRAPEFFTILVVMIIFATVSTLLRVYVRLRIVKAFGRDDYLMVAALVSRCFVTLRGLSRISH